jgi:hypothetical protein
VSWAHCSPIPPDLGDFWHHDPRLRIATHPTHCCQREQPGEAIRVLQPSLFAHRQITPGFPLGSKPSNLCAAQLSSANLTILYALDFPKTLM